MIQDISPLTPQTKACPVSDRATGGSPHCWSINFTRLCFAENAESRLSVWIWGWDLDPWVPPLEQTAGFYWVVRSNLVNITQLFAAFDLFFPNVGAISRLRVVLFHATCAVTLIIQKITCILWKRFDFRNECGQEWIQRYLIPKNKVTLLFYRIKNDKKGNRQTVGTQHAC